MNSESTFCLYDLVILNFLCIWDHTNLTLYRTAKLFSKVTEPLYIPTSNFSLPLSALLLPVLICDCCYWLNNGFLSSLVSKTWSHLLAIICFFPSLCLFPSHSLLLFSFLPFLGTEPRNSHTRRTPSLNLSQSSFYFEIQSWKLPGLALKSLCSPSRPWTCSPLAWVS